MYRIVQNSWIDEVRKRKTRGDAGPDALETLVSSDGRRDAETGLTLDQALRSLETLPEEQRVVLMLVCVEGFSYREVAEMLDIQLGTVMSRLARARRKLVDMMTADSAPPIFTDN